MGDALAREHRQLLSAVDRFGGLREHLAQPIWGDGDERVRGELAHARAPPAGEIGDDDVLREMQLGRVEDQPTTGPAARSKGPVRSLPRMLAARACGTAGRGDA